MQLIGMEASTPAEWSEIWKQTHDKIEEMHQEYRNSLICLGFDPEGKDLLEIIIFLTNELNKTKAELADLKSYTELKFYRISHGDLSL